MVSIAIVLFILLGLTSCTEIQGPEYPPLLQSATGKKIKTIEQWEQERRPELLGLFASEIYGIAPDVKVETTYRIVEEDTCALNGDAVRRQVRITFRAHGMERSADMLLYIPKNAGEKVPVIFGLNSQGNYATSLDPQVVMTDGWVAYPEGIHRAADSLRGRVAYRWPYSGAVNRGYAVATIFKGDFYPDHQDAYGQSVLPMLYAESTIPDSARMQAIGAWAWGISQAMDYFETVPELDARKVMVLGHSRLGKTALWAAANDTRIAIAVSNNSGCTGAALSRNKQGENITKINTRFPYWFADNYKSYNDREFALPVDQHMLLALIAPRPVYVASASRDKWADPHSEFGAARLCGEVYRLYGRQPLTWDKPELPAVNTPLLQGDVGYHLREGKHDITTYDWEQYMNFADKYLK